ncbi:hydrolase 2, exosortase A system-associated [Noviherbaspirillum sedimenti]|uniref:Hydrolase 2, exosortase A system-associated n=1 Tax=Noviherbaspirillum sedimenti TaxID=2320865 RepID=A0A3A3GHW9_9BURK|nr:hydrolase 2, exosortase A system-associated [Noviherbaspirillum sedimenti]RJG01866.1 hydrolase 2, exosortase A system-associated [Noviherbaspirillum sedimenti]
MNTPQEIPSARPFFLDAGSGNRFCLYHAPISKNDCRGAIIYVHPFAEEMNKSRRMAARQARTFAAQGYAVLQIDLLGCGDSSGDFADARWEIWKEDLAHAYAWLRHETAAPISLWGLRLGALLALDFASGFHEEIQGLLLWQPVLRGELFLTQFLRLQLAADMLTGQSQGENGTRQLRARLQTGTSVEVAGYRLAPALAQAIDTTDAAILAPPRCTTYWFELMQGADRPLTPAASRLAAAWTQNSVDLRMHQLQCPAFWIAQETVDCPDLLSATSAAFGVAPT